MSKKKGLSFDEKRDRMIELFFEKKDFFQLKDLEKMAPKEKGITAQTVKEVLQSLVNDGLVDSEKIGTSIYFWSFPSKASQSRKRKLQDIRSRLEEIKAKSQDLQSQIVKAKIGKEDCEERTLLLTELKIQKEKKQQLGKELEKYQESDPEILEKLKQEADMAHEAANRWTDNIFSTKSWIKQKFSFEDKQIDQQFGIPSDFDYVQ
ncbi:meiotic nuclear division protein 1 homolog isoform X1 [Pomacea canaliculata]|uniref:meiotic nuclear division protein 1 homolog isoform X1 n=1 Tax=Pomacea canaliculata TaxID=400727 RepID=UPI000D735E51|nr:meiotic nuclear division protein 1 homolog isoform X1 [Pomacea canaliculata]